MKITIFKDLKQFTLTSTLTKDDIALVKKYRLNALKIKDADGNDVFGMSYVDGKHSVSKSGITFGSAACEGGYAMIVGEIPADLPANTSAKEYIADLVGAALPSINVLEEAIPAVVAAIKSERADLLSGVTEV